MIADCIQQHFPRSPLLQTQTTKLHPLERTPAPLPRVLQRLLSGCSQATQSTCLPTPRWPLLSSQTRGFLPASPHPCGSDRLYGSPLLGCHLTGTTQSGAVSNGPICLRAMFLSHSGGRRCLPSACLPLLDNRALPACVCQAAYPLTNGGIAWDSFQLG